MASDIFKGFMVREIESASSIPNHKEEGIDFYEVTADEERNGYYYWTGSNYAKWDWNGAPHPSEPI